MSVHPAVTFLSKVFLPGDRICLAAKKTDDKIFSTSFKTLEEACSEETLNTLSTVNDDGANIYVCMNAIIEGHDRRRKVDIGEIRSAYLDIDKDGKAKLDVILADRSVPAPIVLESSPEKFQAIWPIQGITKEQQEALLDTLIAKFGGDPAASDCSRVLRLPGFVNAKYSDGPEVKLISDGGDKNPYSLEDFKVEVKPSVAPKPFEVYGIEVDGPEIPLHEHDVTLHSIAGKLRSMGEQWDETAIYDRLFDICEKRIPTRGSDWIDMVAKHAKRIAEKPAGAEDTFLIGGKKPGENVVPNAQPEIRTSPFKYPAVSGGHRDYVIGPLPGQIDGWFPLGDPSIINGPSGGGKTTWMTDLLDQQARKENFFGHQTFGKSFLILMFDRGENAFKRTMERMQLPADKFPVKRLPQVVGQAAPLEILEAIEADGPDKIPQVVFIEAADALVEDVSKGRLVVQLMESLQCIARHYHIAFILSIGAPKMRIGEGYVAKRDSNIGSEKWGRFAETIVAMQYVDGDDTDLRRSCFILLRNGPAEKFDLIMEGGRLVPNTHVEEEQVEAPEVRWYKHQAEQAKVYPEKAWWTALDMERSMAKSHSAVGRWIQDALAKQYIIEKRGPKNKIGKGGAHQYQWNESNTNSIWREEQEQKIQQQLVQDNQQREHESPLTANAPLDFIGADADESQVLRQVAEAIERDPKIPKRGLQRVIKTRHETIQEAIRTLGYSFKGGTWYRRDGTQVGAPTALVQTPPAQPFPPPPDIGGFSVGEAEPTQ